jgi:hypothetical protein
LKRTYTESEFDIQAALFEWAEWAQGKFPELKLLNGSLNGVRLTIGQAVKAKRAGMKRGFPDISLPIARGQYHGLFIELKKPGEYPTAEQKEWCRALRGQGYYADIQAGFELAQDTLIRYLNLNSGEGLIYMHDDEPKEKRHGQGRSRKG